MKADVPDGAADQEAGFYASRTCAELSVDRGQPSLSTAEGPLRAWRDVPAYVLLGDAGAGKSTEFTREWRDLGEGAVFRSARDFLTLGAGTDCSGKTLFIDGLDEVRVGAPDSRVPLDEIRRKLQELGSPRFRISCREADWLGSNDRQHLEAVVPDGRIKVLRLNPLTADAAADLLAFRLGAEDGRDVADRAARHGVATMLTNPLTLDLLVAAYAESDSGDPQSRHEVFETACSRMALEYNSEHRAAAAQQPVHSILTAAGELCARQLLVGIEGFSLADEDAESSSVSVDTLVPIDSGIAIAPSEAWRPALRTKLFAAPLVSSGTEAVRLVPRHRQVAEFLGGRFLGRLIDEGLPARRVVALLTSPSDGRVVTSLRGLSAWLAVHSSEALGLLIDSDPVGLGLYGDIAGLTANQKHRLLRALAADARRGPLLGHERRDRRTSGFDDSTPWAFRSVASADTVTTVSDLLSDRSEEHASERTAEFLLEVLASSEDEQNEALVGLVPQVEAIVRDDMREPMTRRAALDAYLNLAPVSPERDRHLAQLLHGIKTRTVSDPDDELAGTLLRELYPVTVTPADAWQYLRIQNRPNLYGRFQHFWHQLLREQSTPDDVIALLDAFGADAAGLRHPLEEVLLDGLPRELLADALEKHGDEIVLERLFDWLSAVGASARNVPTDALPTTNEAAAEALALQGDSLRYSDAAEELRDPLRRVRSWLESRPGRQKSIFLMWLRTRDEDGPLGFEAYWQCDALCRSRYPADFGSWCLQSAVDLSGSEPEIADELMRWAYGSLNEPSIGAGLTLETMVDHVSDIARLRVLLEKLREPPEYQRRAEQLEHQRRARSEERDAQLRAHHQEWDTHLRDNRHQLSENTYPADLLGRLGKAYFGLYSGVGRHAPGAERVSEFIGGDSELVEEVLTAFRRALLRPDAPDADETISLRSESQQSWLAYPVLAGLEIMDTEDPDTLDAIDDTFKCKALALYYCVPTNAIGPPPWHDRWVQLDPELVADVISQCAARALRNGDSYLPGLNELEDFPGHDDLKHRVRLGLLKALPTRTASASLRSVDRLLVGALEWHSLRDLRDLIQHKTALKSMPVSQRIHWLTAGWLAPDPRCFIELRRLIRERDARVRHVAEFLHNASNAGMSVATHLTERVDPTTRTEFIAMLGRAFGPLQRDGIVTLEMEMAEVISSVIFSLSSPLTGSSSQLIEDLMGDPQLAAWHEHLRYANEKQRIVERDASYRPLTMTDVERTLSGSSPANAADLTALVLDRLDDIRSETKGSATNLWGNFWNVDSHGKPTNPRPENTCRDTLLEMLRRRLPSSAGSTPEAVHAGGKRADISIRYGPIAVPIEIKPSMSPKLWTGLRDQLIEQYTTDPDADGHGIYLALWFGSDLLKQPSDEVPPATPDELERRLEAELSAEESRKISVMVLDVTKPGNAKRTQNL